MKIRTSYVSNSSSSSFIVCKDLSDKGISCLKLNDEQKKLINGTSVYDEVIKLDLSKDFWLTQFIGGCDDKYDIIAEIDHILYQEGQLNETPRNEDFYNEYQNGSFGESVYILKRHDTAKQMNISKFAREHKKMDLPQDFLVKYEEDGIKLIYVW